MPCPPALAPCCWYDGLYHELFQEREPDRTRVLADMSSWLEGQLAQPGMRMWRR